MAYPVDKMFLNFDTFWITVEEARISNKFRQQQELEPRDQFINVPEYVQHEFDVPIRNIPSVLRFEENFYKRWRPHGLVQMMWVATVYPGGSTDHERPIARFDNAAGALMFYMAEK